MSKKAKRRMPPHIVLPNGMWRFVKSGSKKARASSPRKKKRLNTQSPKTKKRRVRTVARRKTSRRVSRRSVKGSLMNGFFKPRGLIAAAVLGMGAASIASQINVPVPYKREAAAFLVGGVPAVAGVIAGDAIAGKISSGASAVGSIIWN